MADDGHYLIGDRKVPIVSMDDMTWDELREVKRISGMSPGKVAEAVSEGDPDAWLALAFVSLKRVDPAAKVDDLGSVKMFDVIGGADDPLENEPPESDDDELEAA